MGKENRLVVANTGWADTIPEWLLEEVKAERLIYGLGSMINPDGEKVGDAEVTVYLYTESLTQPLGREHYNIYLFLTAKLLKKKGIGVPDSLKEQLKQGLSHDDERALRELRGMIYSNRGGDISHPLLDAMRKLKKDIGKRNKVKEGKNGKNNP